MSNLDLWRGEFGNAYTDRNNHDWHPIVPRFQTMLAGLKLPRILEVGCNRAINLMALEHVFPDSAIVGIEPNEYARNLAPRDRHFLVEDGDAFNLPVDAYDLVFTSGVLIHMNDDELKKAIHSIVQCSRRYILANEYYSAEDVDLDYRGQKKAAFKRDFWRHYQEQAPTLTLLRSGTWTLYDGDVTNWWLMEKPQ